MMPVSSLSLGRDPCGTARADEITIIAHELRNSLAVVQGAARLLRAAAEGAGIDAARVLIERHAAQMSRHIDDMLCDPHGGKPASGLQLSRVDLRVIARNATDAVAAEIVRRGHRLVVNLPECPAWVQADGTRLEQAFANLLINAAKYTPDCGDIALTLERLDRHVCVRICDSGVGMEPSLLPRIFDLYVQSSAARHRANGGRGIGLAVVRNLIEQHGGTVQATSAGAGQGSEFIVLMAALPS